MRKIDSRNILFIVGFFLLFLTTEVFTFGQTPSTFNYQAVLRDGDGNVRKNSNVDIEFVIHQGTATGTSVYDETYNTSTNAFGLVNLEVGSVDPTAFALIDWSSGSYFLEVKVDETSMGTSQLLSVPYALHAASVDDISIEDADADPTNEIQSLHLSGTNLTLSLGGGSVTLPTSGGGDNWGTQVVESNVTLTGEGTTASPLGVQQSQLSLDWNNIQDIPSDFEDGIDDVDDADHDPSNELQSISIDADQLTLSDGGGTVTLPSGSGGGDITEVIAGVGLDGGGTTGSVTLDLEVPLHLTSSTNEVIRGDHSGGSYGYLGGSVYGVYGSSNGSGVFGYSSNWGVYGRNQNNNSGSLGGDDYGVYGSYSSNGNHGYIGSENYGVYGLSGSGSGVYGISNSGPGLSGYSQSDVGVYGQTQSEYGVYGYHSNSGNNGYIGGDDNGVWGYASEGYGVEGFYSSGNYGYLGSASCGAYGEHLNGNFGIMGDGFWGVRGRHLESNHEGRLGGSFAGVYAEGGDNGIAGSFDGDVIVGGELLKFSGSFLIDHPLDPANKFLKHSFVESPDMMNIYNGNVILDTNGEAVIDLPEWFEALNKDFRYQLTCIGGYANVFISQKIVNNQFSIAGGSPGLEVSWQVTGVRKDAYANLNRVQVEERKEGDQIGKYLHPEAFGLPESMGIAYERYSFTEPKQDTSVQ